MRIIPLHYPLTNQTISELDKPVAIAIGHFDGVHRGHQKVIRRAIQIAKEQNMLSAVMTFDPHPKEVLGQGDHYYRCLTPLEEKSELFAQLGVDLVFVMRFNLSFAEVSPECFVEEVLRTLHTKHAVVGFDFTFGHKGSGNTEALKQLCEPEIAVHIIEPLYEGDKKVSSTYTREALENGDLELAERLLGRPYEMTGVVVKGDGRGRTIGFPTANLSFEKPYVPLRIGVYAVKVWLDGHVYKGVLNNGMKPTFNKEGLQPVMETHLLDFNADIYGKTIKLQFISFIRPERKFGSVDELISQIGKDAEQASGLLDA